MIKLTINFLLNLILLNKFKVIFLIIALISYNYAEKFPDEGKEYLVLGQLEIDNKYDERFLYITEKILGNDIKFEVLSFTEPQVINNNRLVQYEYNILNVLFWASFSIFIAIVIITTLINDKDVGWDIDYVWSKTLKSLIYSEEEDGVIYYMALGRLLHKSDKLKTASTIVRLGFNSLSDVRSLPKFQTKKSKRQSILEKIGIK